MSDILFLSLIQDINSLETLILKIYDLQKDTCFTINSWRQPTKNFTETINFNVDEAQPSTLQYTTILEVLIDRLYVLLNQYLEQTVHVTIKCSSQALAGKPAKISLGALNINLWENIQNICLSNKSCRKICNVETKLKVQFNLKVENKGTQIEDVPSSQCNSCFVAINCIKNIARLMEMLLPHSFTEKNRKQLEPNIFELTQFGCMNSIITALLADVSVLAENIKKTRDDCRDVSAKNVTLCGKLENAFNCIANLEIELTKLENENEKSLGEIEKYRAEFRSKCESENTYKSLLKSLPQELQIANDKASSLQNELQSVQYNESIRKSQIDNLQKQQELIIVDRDVWKLKSKSSRDENINLKQRNEDLANEIADLTDGVQRTEESYMSMKLLTEVHAGKMDEKINNHQILLDKLQGTIEKKLLEQEQENVKLKKGLSQTSIIHDAANSQKQDNNSVMKGNPIEDMTKQIEMNNMNMKKLKAQNDTLIHTINKLQAIQAKKRISIF